MIFYRTQLQILVCSKLNSFSCRSFFRNDSYRYLRIALLCCGLFFGWNGGRELSAEEKIPAPQVHTILKGQIRIVDLTIVDGRLRGTSTSSVGRTIESNVRSPDRKEHLSLTPHDGIVTMRYESKGTLDELLWEMNSGREVRIHFQRRTAEDKPPELLQFLQPFDGPVTLTLSEGTTSRRWRAPSLWHLYIFAPSECREKLFPLFNLTGESLSQLAVMADGMERELWKITPPSEEELKKWSEMVELLGKDSFADRQQGERGLRLQSRQVVPFLMSLNTKNLDAEQLRRVRAVIRSFTDSANVNGSNSLEMTAWMNGDPWVWYYLMSRGEGEKKQKGLERLEKLLEIPLLDQWSNEEARQESQLRQLRQQIIRLHSPEPLVTEPFDASKNPFDESKENQDKEPLPGKKK